MPTCGYKDPLGGYGASDLQDELSWDVEVPTKLCLQVRGRGGWGAGVVWFCSAVWLPVLRECPPALVPRFAAQPTPTCRVLRITPANRRAAPLWMPSTRWPPGLARLSACRAACSAPIASPQATLRCRCGGFK